MRNNSPIECECCIDHHRWHALPSNLTRGHGCPVCAGKTVKIGINDINTTSPETKKFLLHIEDGFLYTKNSHKHIDFKCPHCGFIRNLQIKSVVTQGFSCPICGDGVSYPNKFARCFLKQLNLDYLEFEYHPDWSGKYFYDNYFEYKNKSYILEMDGSFHYKDNTMSHQSKYESKRIDDIKDNLAKQHNIIMIRVDCRKSDPYFIEKNIKESLLGEIFNLQSINWGDCNSYGHTNLVKIVCDFYQLNKITYSRKDICEYFSICGNTLSRYLTIGKKAGWIIDDIDKSLLASIHNHIPTSQRVIVRDLISNNILYDFKSLNLCAKYLSQILNIKVTRSMITYAIQQKNGVYKDYKLELIKKN